MADKITAAVDKALDAKVEEKTAEISEQVDGHEDDLALLKRQMKHLLEGLAHILPPFKKKV